MAKVNPGEHFEELYVDEKTGARYDQRGNAISAEAQNFDPNAIAYYTPTLQPLKYVDVYPGPVNVHQNQALSDIAVSFELDRAMFVGPEIAPVATVSKRSDIFYKVSRDDVVRDYAKGLERPVDGVANSIQQGFDTDTYTAKEYAVRDFLPDKVANNADEALELMTRITEFLTSVIDLSWDRRLVTDMITATGTFTNTTWTATGGGKPGAATPTNPFVTTGIDAAKVAIIESNNGRSPTHIVMNVATAQAMRRSQEVRDTVKHQVGESQILQGGWAGPNYGLPSIFQGLRVVVLPHVSNSAKKGQTGSFTSLLGDTVGFFIVDPPSRRTTNAVTTFRVDAINVRTYRDEARRGTFIEVSMDQDEKVTNPNGGYLLTDAI